MNKKCRWNVAESATGSLNSWIDCGEPVVVRRKGEGYCAKHDPVAKSAKTAPAMHNVRFDFKSLKGS